MFGFTCACMLCAFGALFSRCLHMFACARCVCECVHVAVSVSVLEDGWFSWPEPKRVSPEY